MRIDCKMQRWLNVLVILLILKKSHGLLSIGQLVYVDNSIDEGAVCLDGTPPAYHFSEGSGSGVNNWLVHIEGGGWCNNITTCLERKITRLGSSLKMEPAIGFIGILNNDPEFNPDFYNWNRVKIGYCDGSSLTGDVKDVDPATNLHFRGARIWNVVIQDLLGKGMDSAKNALLSGCSAGGLATIFHCDNFSSSLPKTANVKCLSDAGYFINMRDITGAAHVEDYFNDIVTLHGSAKHLPYCASGMKPSACFFPQYIVSNIQTPIFILNAAYDSWQIRNVLVPTTADPNGTWDQCKDNINYCSPHQVQLMQGFRQEFLRALTVFDKSWTNGMFINSCFAHCQTEMQRFWLTNNSTILNGKKVAVAVGDWFYNRSPFQKIDCPYPCNPTCVNNIYST